MNDVLCARTQARATMLQACPFCFSDSRLKRCQPKWDSKLWIPAAEVTGTHHYSPSESGIISRVVFEWFAREHTKICHLALPFISYALIIKAFNKCNLSVQQPVTLRVLLLQCSPLPRKKEKKKKEKGKVGKKKAASGAVRHKFLPLKGWIFLSINRETLRESSMNCPYLNRYIEQLLCPPVHKVSFNIN